MARKRMIDPSFWEDEKLGSCDPVTRLLFMGLISQADDEGRLKGHPSLLRSIIFPYDDLITVETIEIWLTKLADIEHQLIRRYEVDNQKYIFITNFKKHQTINKPQKSKLPEYYGNTTVIITEQSGIDTAQKKLIEVKGSEEEEKGREDSRTLSDSNQRDYLRDLCTQMKIQGLGVYHLDIVYSYIGIAENEVIVAAIKKSQNKPHSYLTNTLHGMINVDKITKAEQLPGAKAGDNVVQFSEGIRQGFTNEHDRPYEEQPEWKPPAKYQTELPDVSGH